MEYPPCMDNNRLIVVSKTRTDFDLAMQLAFRHTRSAEGYWFYTPKKDSYRRDELGLPSNLLGVCSQGTFLVLSSWKNMPDFISFPCDIDWETASEFAWKWLEQQDYGTEPDHDGSNSHGFVIFNDSWGHVGNDFAGICAIGPAWAMHGK
jgi:hypothetical protein